MSDMTADQALGFLLSSILCGDEFGTEHESAAAKIRAALSAPRAPEGWRIRRVGEVMLVTKPSLGGCAAGEDGRYGIAESILYQLCNDMLTTAPPEQKEIE